MKGFSSDKVSGVSPRRSPRLASKRRASMSVVDDVNKIFGNGGNIAKPGKPSVKSSSKGSSVGFGLKEPSNTRQVPFQFDTNVSEPGRKKSQANTSNITTGKRKSPRDHQFKRPQLKSRRKYPEFARPHLNKAKLKKPKAADFSGLSHSVSMVGLDQVGGYAMTSEKRRTRKRKARDECFDVDMDEVDLPGLSASNSSSSLKRWKEDDDDDEDDVDTANVTLTGYRTLPGRGARFDDDNLSIQSFTMGYSSRRNRSSLARVSSLANLISPVSSVKKVGQALQRSMSFRSSHSPSIYIKPYSKPAATPTKRRDSKLWSQTVTHNINEGLTKVEIKRQEAIFELYQGEVDLVEDLQLILKTYRDSMKQLGILNQQELSTIFFRLEELVLLHEDLIERLEKLRQEDGRTDAIGKDIVEWLPELTDSYTSYCVNQLAAKSLLDEKKQDKRVQDFLERCQESPFSRKLDLWNFLDVPRSRLVKYPLLLKNILRLTPTDHEDKNYLSNAILRCDEIIKEVDKCTGEHKCQYYINQLEYLDENQRHPLIAEQKSLHCMGMLRNNKGSKLYTFLFEDILVVTRTATRNGIKCYQVTRLPIPIRSLHLEDVPDGELRTGSFRGAFSSNQSSKHAFRVTSTDPNLVQSFTFIASDEHDKKQWMQMIRNAISLSSDQNSEAD